MDNFRWNPEYIPYVKDIGFYIVPGRWGMRSRVYGNDVRAAYTRDGTKRLRVNVLSWDTPDDPEEAKRLEELALNMCYARYGRGDS